MTKRVPITVWLTPMELATIDRIAAQLERPRSSTVVRMLNQALDNAHRLPVRITTSRKPKPEPDGPYPYPGGAFAERLDGGGWRDRHDSDLKGLPVRNIPRTDGPWCEASVPTQRPGGTVWQCTEPAHGDGWHIAVAGRTVVAVWPTTQVDVHG